ncbi:RluA family pseudouridine synthase [Saprospira sp. CCB-QB6]|uniref:RluA family pseudouridine synthase n=1 Tax=Saprospira sp. CCB-QB6 TaxID=3023936 RepID=UPI0023498D66|nr:RluA family pseudouridine synthase [Saprospira sp. CCB-QB6]WCL80872.1 RluA family pseudouridine synthase [Saprospira sp. CCB-QB6]
MDPKEEMEFEDEPLFDWYEYKADPGQEPMRLDKFLMQRMERMTRSKVQRGIDAGYVTVNDKEAKSNQKIKPHDLIKVRWRRARPKGEVIAQDIPLDIRYEDEEVLMVYKPAGMVVHPGVGNYTGTLVNALAWHFKDLPQGNGSYPGLVHRIDKFTTGILVVAKTEEAIQHLSKQFFHHTIKRKYRALVWGDVEAEEGTITGHIGRDPKNRKRFCVYEDEEYGKHAVTHYKVLKRFGYVTLVECQLETGRTHQIRVHMKHIGHPLFNDELYNGDRIVKGTIFSKYRQFVENCFKILPHQALHAYSLGFEHPKTGEEIYLEAPLPDYFQQALDKWEKYTEGRFKIYD